MTTFNKKTLLADLHDRITLLQNNLIPFLKLSEQDFHFKTKPSEWSIAEIFEHLNIANAHYLYQMEQALTHAQEQMKDDYQSSWLGDWFYDKMMPRPDGSVFKMPAPKRLHAHSSHLNGKQVLQQFIHQLEETQYVIDHAALVDLAALKIQLSFTNLFKLRMGDVLRFVVAHNERHLLQANKMMSKLNCSKQ